MSTLLWAIGGGFGTGIVAGVVGLGGAELRLPILLWGMALPLRAALTVNLAASLLTSSASVLLRFSYGLGDSRLLPLILWMGAGSIPGGYVGGVVSRRIGEPALKIFLAVLLLLVAVRFFLHSLFPAEPRALFDLFGTAPLAVGFAVGMIAGLAGVAGGEYRIPFLFFLFGQPLVAAGTISQAVSVPTVIAALYGQIKGERPGAAIFRAAAPVGFASVLGVSVGTGLVLSGGEPIVRAVLVGVLLFTSGRLFWEGRRAPRL